MFGGAFQSNSMRIGTNPEDSESVVLNPDRLLRHVGILGNTGSGKTVMAKIILEECALAGIPSIILDLQGDLARMALPTIRDQRADSKRQSEWNKCAEVRIWTPLEESGIPICLSPFTPPAGLDADEDGQVKGWDRMAAGLAEILDYDVTKKKGKKVKAFLYRHLVHLGDKNRLPSDFGELADSIGKVDASQYDDLIKSSEIKDLVMEANSHNTGIAAKLYTHGSTLSIPLMLESRLDGRTPVNVLYLNTLPDQGMKMAFIQQFCRMLYDWMIQNPSGSKGPQLMLFLDEAGEFIPPDPHMPASKSMLRQLLKQGRKYGIGCMLASQSPGDLDYRTFGQANTTFLGRFLLHQERTKIGKMLRGMGSDPGIADQLPTLDPGQFLMVSSGSGEGGVSRIDTRWLLTDHGDPLTAGELVNLVPKASRDWAKKFSSGSSGHARPKISQKLRESARAPSGSGLSKASTSSPILGGFTHLADKSDPLHALMGMTNLVTALTLLLCTSTLGNLWKDGELSQLPFAVSAAICSMMGIGLALEFVLRDDTALSSKIRAKARPLLGVVLIWVWILWLLNREAVFDLSEWGFMILISQTLLTAFFVLEAFHRVRLGSLDVDGNTLVDKMSSGFRGIPGVLTGAEIDELRATSEQIHETLRTFMEVVTLGLVMGLMITEMNLNTPWVSDLAVRIVCLDAALLISKSYVTLKS